MPDHADTEIVTPVVAIIDPVEEPAAAAVREVAEEYEVLTWPASTDHADRIRLALADEPTARFTG